MGFWIFMVVMALLLPVSMVGIGLFYRRHAPKRINGACGYRTARSMKSQQAWDFSNHRFAELWLCLGWGMLPITVLTMLFCLGRDTGSVTWFALAVEGVQLVVMVGSIIPVEIALKRNFAENGRPRSS